MKKHKSGSVGKALIRDRFKKRNPNRDADSFLHTSELNDGYDWGRLNLQSVTEQSNLDDFLTTAELAGVDFTAEKLNVRIVDVNKNTGLLTAEETKNVKQLHEQHKSLLRIPRRPAWDTTTTAEELNTKEREAFLEWRRGLSKLQEVDGIVMTPYEKNLDFWRQLWRVIERSDVLVQIVDARCPLLFYCEDLECYVKEVDPEKVNLLLINKADYLTCDQRKMWCKYFNSRNVKVAFWSALEETARYEQDKKERIDTTHKEDIFDDVESDEEEEDMEEVDEDKDLKEDDMQIAENKDSIASYKADSSDEVMTLKDVDINKSVVENISQDDCIECKHKGGSDKMENQTGDHSEAESRCDKDSCSEVNMYNDRTSTDKSNINDKETKHTLDCDKTDSCMCNSTKVLNGLELLDLFRTLHKGRKYQSGVTTVGMVGYPNVGKSSSINAILKTKKVPVSSTPGRTKHFQTLYVESDLMMCDCPGLVFPSFVSTKADLIVNGILPIDQMRDHVPPVSLVCQCIPRHMLENTYGINIPKPDEGEDQNRPPTAQELLNSYGYMRGFMTSNGLPDCPRSSRYILKDFVKGRLLYCHPPPDVDPAVFHSASKTSIFEKQKTSESTKTDDVKPEVSVTSELDKEFFRKSQSKVHSKGVHGVAGFARAQGVQHVATSSGSEMDSPSSSQSSLTSKPWKKHNNHKKKEKLKKVYSDHDI